MSNEFAPEYVDVAERLQLLFDKHPDASLRGTYELMTVADQTFICYTAECFRHDNDTAPGVGTAWEPVPGRTPFTRGSEMQNAETSAWGRAIVAVGAAPSKHVASADEVRNRQTETAAGPVSANQLVRARERAQALQLAKVSVASARKAAGLPTLTEGIAPGTFARWLELLDQLEADLEAMRSPFEDAEA
jgi:hypothetical protein